MWTEHSCFESIRFPCGAGGPEHLIVLSFGHAVFDQSFTIASPFLIVLRPESAALLETARRAGRSRRAQTGLRPSAIGSLIQTTDYLLERSGSEIRRGRKRGRNQIKRTPLRHQTASTSMKVGENPRRRKKL
ncbi:MAG: hypothetical protein ABI217_06695 [Chthoniobacterales bacterium]